MNRDPADRLARLVRHARRGFAEIHRDPDRAERARRWLVTHPSHEPAVDALWTDALDGRGDLVRWHVTGVWDHPLFPLHTVLASHPFPDLDVWSIQPTFRAS